MELAARKAGRSAAEIKEFLIPQFDNDKLPDGLTVHGFGEDGSGELYAMVTNSPSNGTGGIVYRFLPIPEPASIVLMLLALVGASVVRGRSVRRDIS